MALDAAVHSERVRIFDLLATDEVTDLRIQDLTPAFHGLTGAPSDTDTCEVLAGVKVDRTVGYCGDVLEPFILAVAITESEFVPRVRVA